MSWPSMDSESGASVSIQQLAQTMEADAEHLKAHWCLPQAEARLLYLLARVGRFQRLLEVGTSIGYSTLHLAWAALASGGTVHTIDASAERQQQAQEHLGQVGLGSVVTFLQGDALRVLQRLLSDGQTFDLMFVDARKSEYLQYFELAQCLLQVGGLWIADNTQSHRGKMQDLIERIHRHPHWEVSDLETTSGLLVAHKLC